MLKLLLGYGFGLFFSMAALAADVGIVTALTGSVQLQEGIEPARDIKAFVKLRENDKLTLKANTRLQIVFFEKGAQETWQGAGVLRLGSAFSQLIQGNPQVERKNLPLILVNQLTKTPSLDRGRAGMVRVRAMHAPDELVTLEKNYTDLRKNVPASERSPELFLLAGYFDLKEFEKLKFHLDQLVQNSPEDIEIKALQAHYAKAMDLAKVK
ncbi:MAG: hypothetical protein PHH58_12535 [Rhodoferax sp.]|nr:hypothetical protein [Rhodoferax sp.]